MGSSSMSFLGEEIVCSFCQLCSFPRSLTWRNHEHLSFKTVKLWRHYFKSTCGDLFLLSIYLLLDPILLCLPGSSKLNFVLNLHIECFTFFLPGPGVRKPKFESRLHHLLSGGFLASSLTPLCLSFIIYKMGVRKSASLGCCKDQIMQVKHLGKCLDHSKCL